jgi:hypothetical protein
MFVSVSNLRATVFASNSRVVASVSNSRVAASVFTSDSEYPDSCTLSDVALYYHAKGDEESTWQVSTAVAEDVVQVNKGQTTIQIDDCYDAG